MTPVEIVLDTPGKNCLGTASMTSLLARIRAAGDAPLLLGGTADAFSAGLDLKEVASQEAAGMERFLVLLEDVMTALYLHPAPTVAAVNGHAIAGGCVLTLCCDHRVMTDSPRAKIGLNEVALGVRFPPRVLAIVRARVPRQHLAEVVLGAGLHDASSGLRLGLVDELAADVLGVARARLAALAAHPSRAYAMTKRDLRGTPETLCPEPAWSAALREAVPTWISPSVKEKLTAVLRR